MRIILWKGFHSEELFGLIERTWAQGDLLILCPPFLRDLSFTKFLPSGPIEFHGEWDPSPAQTGQSSGVGLDYPTAPVLGVFTTGTVSGQPRLVLYSKRNIESSLDSILALFDQSQIESVFCYPQPFHTFGLILGYVLCLLKGYKLVTGRGRYATEFHQVRADIRTDRLLTLGTPTHFLDLMQFLRTQKRELMPSYSAIIGGAKVSVSLWREIRDTLKIRAPSIGYGATEASPGIAHHPPGREPSEDGEIGFAFENLHLQLDPMRGLEFSGPSVCLAMIQGDRIEFPSKIFISDDVRQREDGMLIYHGRTELILNRGGQKFSLEYMEELVRKKLNLEVVCVSLPDPRLGEELGVLLRASSGQDDFPQREQVHQTLCQEFGSKFDLKNFKEVAEFPLNENLKLDRKMGTQICLKLRSEGAV